MAYSFVQIEKDKSRNIGFVFFILIGFYFFTILGLTFLVKSFVFSLSKDQIILSLAVVSWNDAGVCMFLGFALAAVHYLWSTSGLTAKTILWLRAYSPKMDQDGHKMFFNIVQEVSAATGGKPFEGMIIPHSALNAFAVDDGQSVPVIGVTEGVLTRLSRAQVEAIVAHEAAHILKGDCETATIVSSLFEMFTVPLNLWQNSVTKDNDYTVDIPSKNDVEWLRLLRLGPVIWFFVLVIIVFYAVTMLAARFMRMFISREAKLRADAIAVRLTRDPLSLAQAIRLVSGNWRGIGTEWDALQGIFFVNPCISPLDESEGVGSDLFSTHPPVMQRMGVLLEMCHVSATAFEESLGSQLEVVKNLSPEPTDTTQGWGRKWLLQKENQWYGPFNMIEIGMLTWLNLDTPVKTVDNPLIKRAADIDDIRQIAH